MTTLLTELCAEYLLLATTSPCWLPLPTIGGSELAIVLDIGILFIFCDGYFILFDPWTSDEEMLPCDLNKDKIQYIKNYTINGFPFESALEPPPIFGKGLPVF